MVNVLFTVVLFYLLLAALVLPLAFALVNYDLYSYRFKSRIFQVGSVLAALVAWVLFLFTSGPRSWVLYDFSSLHSLSLQFSLFLAEPGRLLIVTLFSLNLFVHLYSLDYIRKTKHPGFFIYLNFLVLFATILITAGDFILLFVAWEGLGICAYLLAGYWSNELRTGRSGTLALAISELGSMFLLFAFIYLAAVAGTTEISRLSAAVVQSELAGISGLAALIWLGLMTRSLQFPFHVWLAETDKAPLPATALYQSVIPAVSGVYLLVRFDFLFQAAPPISGLLVLVGLLTAILGAVLASAAVNLKLLLSYSTISQLGLMMAAGGQGLFSGAVFQLVSHAFSRLLLFFALGILVLSCDTENIFELGGLGKLVPITAAGTWVGAFSLAGIPPFAGYWSNLVITVSPDPPSIVYLSAVYLVQVLTVFYSFRLLFVLFVSDREPPGAVHENQSFLQYAVLGLIPFLLLGGLFVYTPYLSGLLPEILDSNILRLGSGLLVKIFVVVVTYVIYGLEPAWSNALFSWLEPFHDSLKQGLYFRQILVKFFRRPLRKTANFLAQTVELKLLSPFYSFSGKLIHLGANLLRFHHSGNLGSYLGYFVLSYIFIFLFLIFTLF